MTMTILCIEDDELFAKVLNEHLTKHDHQVHVAQDGESGIEMAGKLLPDLILLDVILPGIDGYQVCKKLKSNAKTKSIPVIMLTGEDKMESVWSGFEYGADDYILKAQHLSTLLPTLDDKIELFSP